MSLTADIISTALQRMRPGVGHNSSCCSEQLSTLDTVVFSSIMQTASQSMVSRAAQSDLLENALLIEALHMIPVIDLQAHT